MSITGRRGVNRYSIKNIVDRDAVIQMLLAERHGHCCALYVSCQACAIERVVHKLDPEYAIEGEGKYARKRCWED